MILSFCFTTPSLYIFVSLSRARQIRLYKILSSVLCTIILNEANRRQAIIFPLKNFAYAQDDRPSFYRKEGEFKSVFILRINYESDL